MEQAFKNRMLELANRCFKTGTYTYSDFLGIADQSDLLMLEREISFVKITLYGGYANADRCIAIFGDEEELGYAADTNIVCLHIKPLLKKFADELTHRDFLGALMNLGIERAKIGDIKILDNEAYIFCLDSIAEYVVDSLAKVKHTSVKAVLIKDKDEFPEQFINDEGHEKTITVSSERVDGIISKVYNLSRNESLELFRSQKIFLNGRLLENNSRNASIGDVINARGYGKFKISSKPRETRKGKLGITVTIW